MSSSPVQTVALWRRCLIIGLIPLELMVTLPVGYAALPIPQARLASRAAIKAPDPLPDVVVRKGVRDLSVFEPKVEFTADVQDEELRQARVLRESLIAQAGDRLPAENAALAQALLAFKAAEDAEAISPLTDFLKAFPTSRWCASIELNLGLLRYETGYFSEALGYFHSAWERSKTDEAAKPVADRAISEYLHLCAKVGRTEELRQGFAAIAGRVFFGSDETRLGGARDGLQTMTNLPERAFKCGPYAVSSILEKGKRAHNVRREIEDEPSSLQGTSLLQVKHLADRVGLDYRLAKRKPGSKVIVPSVIHLKVGHFAGLIDYRDGKYLLQDPTFGGRELWISEAAIEAEGSGYFLVANRHLPWGWSSVSESDAAQVWGRGGSDQRDEKAKTVEQECVPCRTPGLPTPGMPVPSAFSMQATLRLDDVPLYYTPPVGPSMVFAIGYNHREAGQPTTFTYPNFGPNWNFSWVSSLTVDASQNVTVMVRGGGSEVYNWSLKDNVTNVYSPDLSSQAVVAVVNSTYERRLPDGSKEIFAQNDGTGRYFMTQVVDPQGNSVAITYDSNFRITQILDALNQATTITYKSNTVGNAGYYKIARVTDPFGRYASFDYDAGLTRLEKITDAVSLVSQFHYDTSVGSFIERLSTPYGDTVFKQYEFVQPPAPPDGSHTYIGRGLLTIYPDKSEIVVENLVGHWWRTNFWDRKATAEVGGYQGQALSLDLTTWDKARATTFLMQGASRELSPVMKSTKNPLEGEVSYAYAGQTQANYIGNSNKPILVSRLLDDGVTVQQQHFDYNAFGRVTKTTDPLGREVSFLYAADGIDLLEIRQTRAGANELLGKWIYDQRHLPLTAIDGSGRKTTCTYNARGQVQTITNPKNEVTTFTYNSNGYLTVVDGPLTGTVDRVDLAYDSYGRLLTTTDALGRVVTYAYDALNRPVATTYPDATYEQVMWDRLDPVLTRDRLGRWTERNYDALRRVISETDPEGRTTRFTWCNCGSLESYTDAANHTTTFERDLQGRVTGRLYPDGKTVAYAYKPLTGWLDTVTDSLNQVTHHDYNVDGSLQQVSYTATVNATPSVSYTYDPDYLRIHTAANTWGTLTYDYYPYITDPYATPVTGAGQLKKVTHSVWSDGDLTYDYDELGRVTGRQINGSANAESYLYDTAGRISSLTNPLGAFGFTYKYAAEGLPELDQVSYPNGQTVAYDWGTNIQDRRLKQILNKASATVELSRFNYDYRPSGEITAWTQQADGGAAQRYDFDYDEANQLTGATLKDVSSGSVLKRHLYHYDAAGNRDSEQIDTAVQQASHNNVNQLTTHGAGGPTRVQGTLDEAGTVTVAVNGGASTPATMLTGKDFVANPTLGAGTNTVAITAKDGSNNTNTKQWQVTIPTGATVTLSYDANGNLLDDGAGKTFEWDAQNRLLAINTSSTLRTEFTYDPMGRRVKIVEKDNGTVTSTKQHLWAEGAQPVEERDVTNAVTKRFYAHGMQVGTDKYYYTRDHLSSIREMTDSTGAIRARYDYDPYGRRTKVQGDLEAEFGFTGHYVHAASGLNLTLFRVYDTNLGRWLSRDPIGERGGINLYGYVNNNPVNYADPDGKFAIVPVLIASAVGIVVVTAIWAGYSLTKGDAIALTMPGIPLSIYGPKYYKYSEAARSVLRYHEKVHQQQSPFKGTSAEREMEAYFKQIEYIDSILPLYESGSKECDELIQLRRQATFSYQENGGRKVIDWK